MHLGIEPIAIGDIHRSVLRPYHVEAPVFERQIERIALAITDLFRQSREPGQHLRHTAEFGGQVDALDLAAVAAGKKPRWPANPGTDVEHPLAPAESEEIGQSDCRLPLPAVKLVDWSQIVRRQMLDVLPGLLQRRENDLAEILTAVVSLDGILWQFFLLFVETGRTAVIR